MRDLQKVVVLLLVLGLHLYGDHVAAADETKLREPAFAGTWYPADKTSLDAMITDFLSKVPARDGRRPVALISPHAGYLYSGQCAAHGFKAVGEHTYRRVIVLGPTHTTGIRGVSVPSYTHYRTPLGLVEVDREVCRSLLDEPLFQSQDAAHRREHSLESQLPFLQKALGEFKLVPIVVGEIDLGGARRIASSLEPFIDDDTLVVVSSDFTHTGSRFGYVPFKTDVKENLEKLNRRAAAEIVSLEPEKFAAFLDETGATICGRFPILILMALLESRKGDIQAELLDYRASGDVTGDYSDCVAYESIGFFKRGREQAANSGRKGAVIMLTEEGREKLLQIARDAVESAVYGQPKPKIVADEPELQEKCGVFVTLKTDGQLRGCLGQFTSDQPLWQLVSQMAAASATQDPRFFDDRLRPDELDRLQIEISVLSPLEKMDNPLDIELGKDGIYLKCGARTGCFLPQVATETGWSKEEFLSYCCLHKAGLPADAWKHEDTEVYCFKAEIIDEDEAPSR